MKKTKLIFTATLALGLLFCVNDATAQQAVKKVKAQKAVQTQNNQQVNLKAAPLQTHTYKGMTVITVLPHQPKTKLGMTVNPTLPVVTSKPRQD